MSFQRVLRLLLILALIGAGIAAAIKVQQRRHVANDTADEIEAQLSALDPATRAAVIARLGKDAAAAAHARLT
ncbi:MAG TPA: hypothetical protein VMI11_15860 [Actinomycetes bacterium]|nr:hypothetical protein [Actinomycetes bacterium]